MGGMMGISMAKGVLGGIAAASLARALTGPSYHSGGFFGAPSMGGFFGGGYGDEMYEEGYEEAVEDFGGGDFGE